MGLGLAIALGASNTLETLTVNQYFHMLFRVALHLKVSLACPSPGSDAHTTINHQQQQTLCRLHTILTSVVQGVGGRPLLLCSRVRLP